MQMREKEAGERPSHREPRDLDNKMQEEDKGASTTTWGTPFFFGTSHKELRALINARDNQDIWAAMLEVEHPAQEWWEAYRALQKNQDPKQSVLMMLIYQQNLQWLRLRQISGLAYKSGLPRAKNTMRKCREQERMPSLICHRAFTGPNSSFAVQIVMLWITTSR